MIDRFSELRTLAEEENPDGAALLSKDEECGAKDIEAGVPPEAQTEANFMTEYFHRVGVLKAAINETAENVERIKSFKIKAMRATSSDEEKEISLALNSVLSNANGLITKITKALEATKAENDAYIKDNPNSSDGRIRMNMHQALSRRFAAVLADYQDVQNQYKHEMRYKVTRQVKIVYPEMTTDEIEDMISTADVDAASALKARMTGTHQSLTNALADIQDKYRDIRRLEQSVTELHQMFVEVAVLVEHQGELLDQIEFSVTQAKEYTEKAEVELITARKHQANVRKKSCWIMLCLVVLLVCILVPVLISKF